MHHGWLQDLLKLGSVRTLLIGLPSSELVIVIAMSPNRTLCLVATLGQLGLVTASNYAAGPTPTTCAMTEVAEPPPQPTRPPAIHGFLQKRQDASASGANSLCGYVGGEVGETEVLPLLFTGKTDTATTQPIHSIARRDMTV